MMLNVKKERFYMNIEQIKEIITAAAIKADFKYVSFSRNRYGVDVAFGSCYMDDDNGNYFYITFSVVGDKYGNAYKIWENKKMREVTEDEWFSGVEKYFFNICGVQISREEKTA